MSLALFYVVLVLFNRSHNWIGYWICWKCWLVGETEDDVCDKKNDSSENNDKEKELGCLDDTSSDNMEEVVSDTKNDKIENNDEGKELGCLYNTSPDKMEGDVCYKNNYNNGKKGEKKTEWLDDTLPDEMEEDVSDKKNYKSKKMMI